MCAWFVYLSVYGLVLSIAQAELEFNPTFMALFLILVVVGIVVEVAVLGALNRDSDDADEVEVEVEVEVEGEGEVEVEVEGEGEGTGEGEGEGEAEEFDAGAGAGTVAGEGAGADAGAGEGGGSVQRALARPPSLGSLKKQGSAGGSFKKLKKSGFGQQHASRRLQGGQPGDNNGGKDLLLQALRFFYNRYQPFHLTCESLQHRHEDLCIHFICPVGRRQCFLSSSHHISCSFLPAASVCSTI